eukprot:3180706-Prymnesium_polylepis.1
MSCRPAALHLLPHAGPYVTSIAGEGDGTSSTSSDVDSSAISTSEPVASAMKHAAATAEKIDSTATMSLRSWKCPEC